MGSKQSRAKKQQEKDAKKASEEQQKTETEQQEQKQEEKKEEEKKEEEKVEEEKKTEEAAPAEEEKKEEAPVEDKKEEAAPAEEKKEEAAPAEEEKKEEAAPAEEEKKEEAAPAEEEKKEEAAPVEEKKTEEAAPAADVEAAAVIVVVEDEKKTEEVAAVVAKPIDAAALAQIFDDAHTAHGFLDKAVDVADIEAVLMMSNMGPTAYNSLPMRVVFVQSESKDKYLEAIGKYAEGNVAQTKSAPVNAIICVDTEFEDKLDYLMPFVPNASQVFKGDHHDQAMLLNGTLQAGYFILALRSRGYDVGPQITGPGIDELFLADTKWKSIFQLNIGYADESKNYPRAPKHTIEQASKRA